MATGSGSDKPISARSTRARPRVVLGLFFGIFMLFGGTMAYFMFVRPLLHIVAARDWTAVPCEILSSGVRTHSGDKGPTYSVDVTYRYMIGDRSYVGTRYHFLGGASSGYAAKAAIVRQLAPGVHTTCYVNPADPTDAVIERGATSELGFAAIPLLFFAIGAGGLTWVVFGGRKARATPDTATGSRLSNMVRDSGATSLRPAASPRMKFIGFLFFALFWNGIVSVFVGIVLHDWSRGNRHWGLMLFLTPFVAVGVGLIVMVGKQFLALFNPRVNLTASHSSVALGDTLDLRWEITGNAARLQRLRLYVEGREEATYRRGTHTSTDRRVFATWPLVDAAAPVASIGGTARLRMPADTMHTFRSPNNRIVWSVQVRGEIPRWPDVEYEFPVQVTPRPLIP